MTAKYFKVVCKCGHVGRKNYIPIQFAIVAENAKAAAAKAKAYPRVKRDHKDAILGVFEISLEEFIDLLELNNNDPYLKCKNKQEQNLINDLEARLLHDPHSDVEEIDKEARQDKVKYKKNYYKVLAQEAQKEMQL